MKYSSYDQIVVVSSASPTEFQNQFNFQMEKHAADNPRVEFVHREGLFCAYILFQHEIRVPETVEDEFALEGIRYRCKDCPLRDPETDRRRKWVPCKYATTGQTHLTSCACEVFYRSLKRGEIVPVEEEDER